MQSKLILSVFRARQFSTGLLMVSIVASIFLSIQSMGDQLSDRAVSAASLLLNGSANPSAFTAILSSSARSLIDAWTLLGFVSVVVCSSVWAWWVADSKDQEKVLLVEQGAEEREIALSYSLAAVAALVPLFFLSLAFSICEQSLAIGAVDFSLNGTLLFSSPEPWELALAYAIAALISELAVFSLRIFSKPNPNRVSSGRPLGISVSSRKLAVLCITVLVVAFSCSFAFQSTISYAQDIGFYYGQQGTIILPNGPLYLSSSFALPSNISSCSSYSAEVAFPSKVGGLNTVLRGVEESNSSKFLGLTIESGSWSSSVGQITIGSSLAMKLGASLDSVLNVTDLLNGNVSSFLVTGIYRSSYQTISEEIITDLQNARSTNGMSQGRYSYVRTSNCAQLNAKPSFLGIPQIAARLFSNNNQSNQVSYAAFSGSQPLLDSLTAIVAIIILGSAVSLFLVMNLYLKSFSKTIGTLFEQGVPLSKVKTTLARNSVPLLMISAMAGISLTEVILSSFQIFSGLFHYALVPPSLWYFGVFFVVISVPPILSVIAVRYTAASD